MVCPTSHPTAVSIRGYEDYCQNASNPPQMVLASDAPATSSSQNYSGPVPLASEGHEEINRDLHFSAGQYHTAQALLSHSAIWLNASSGQSGNLVMGSSLLADPTNRQAALNRLSQYERRHHLPLTCRPNECDTLDAAHIQGLRNLLNAPAQSFWTRTKVALAAAAGAVGVMSLGLWAFGAMQPAYPNQPFVERSAQVLGTELVHLARRVWHPVESLKQMGRFFVNEWSAQVAREATQEATSTVRGINLLVRVAPILIIAGLAGAGLAWYVRRQE